jgi:GT2 family glycosyltransferase
VLVVDDAGASPAVRALVERFGAHYEPHARPLGLNVARNTGVARSRGPLVVFVDDDVEVCPGWLDALLRAAREQPHAQVLTGPIRARLEGHAPRSCGREQPPITALDLGARDTDELRYAWGANMAVRRSALERIGPFDVSLEHAGDEQEWQDRLAATCGAGHVRYVAAAALHHRRAGADAQLPALVRAARARGRAARRFDAWHEDGRTPSLAQELRTLAECAGHVVRYRCPSGMTMVAHSFGRLEQGVREKRAGRARRKATASEDFLSGESGTVGGRDAIRRELLDRLVDTQELLTLRRLRLARAAGRRPPRRRVLVLSIARPQHAAESAAIRTELERSRHTVELRSTAPGEAGKFENLNRLLDGVAGGGVNGAGLEEYDWLLVIDDDVRLPRGFLDRLLFLAERFELDLVQPAHRARSHAAWRVTRRRARMAVRETPFVEIGPVTAFARATFSTLLPFPGSLRMGWGLDLHWAALARAHGWRCGVLDAVAISHTAAPAADAYSREHAIAEARAFLAERPYLSAREAQLTLRTHRAW